MKTILVICSIFVAVQADLVERKAGASTPNDPSCFLPKVKNAVSPEAIGLLQQELNEHKANREVDLGNWLNGVVKATMEVVTATQGCANVPHVFFFQNLLSSKDKKCVLERAKKKDITNLANSIETFLTDYVGDEEIAQDDFKTFSDYSVNFFYGNIPDSECGVDRAKCYRENSKDAVSNYAITLLQMELNKANANLEVDLGNWHDGVTKATLEVTAAAKGCQGVPDVFVFETLFSSKNKSCVVERAKTKDISTLKNYTERFLADYIGDGEVAQKDFMRFSMYSVNFFYRGLNYTECKPDPAVCFLEKAKHVNVDDTIRALELERAQYNRNWHGNLTVVYDVSLDFHVRVAAAVRLCDALPTAHFLFNSLAQKGKDCMIRAAWNPKQRNLYNAIRDFKNSYNQHNQQLHLDYHKKFLVGSLGYFYDNAPGCNAAANPGTNRK